MRHLPLSHLAVTIGIAQPIGGHIGGGEDVQAARNAPSEALLAVFHSQPGQQAVAPFVSCSKSAQSLSTLQARSSAGSVRAEEGAFPDTEAFGPATSTLARAVGAVVVDSVVTGDVAVGGEPAGDWQPTRTATVAMAMALMG